MKFLLNELFDRLYPLLRSITGDGLEESLRILGEHMPLSCESVPSGTRIFDWETPPQWSCREAVLTAPDGTVVADLKKHNLHVVNYSDSVDQRISKEDLEAHLHSLPNLPEAIPYVTSYYKRTWGFCLPHAVRLALPAGIYHAKIDSSFTEGRIPIAQAVLPGESEEEVLFTSYLCHPSLANNELSGPLVLLGLYKRLSAWKKRRYTYRFVLHPETIGSLCYLHLYGEHLKRHMVAGMVLTCLGGPEPTLSYKLSRSEDTLMDRLALMWSSPSPAHSPARMRIRPFTPCGGSDERQYCSPGFNLPMGQVGRTLYGEYPGYHNSLDTKEFMGIDSLMASIDTLEAFISEFDSAGVFVNLQPYGEPQLGRRGLYPTMNSAILWKSSTDIMADNRTQLERILMILSYCDGHHSMMDIAHRCGCRVSDLEALVALLEDHDLLKFAGSGRKRFDPCFSDWKPSSSCLYGTQPRRQRDLGRPCH